MNMPDILNDPLFGGSQALQGPGQHIYLNVSARLFRTTRTILTKSPFFHHHLSDPGNVDPNGSIIVHADPDLFGHILEYLQHGTYPLFVKDNGSHDIPKYLSCMREARYFHLARLADWLAEARYAEAYVVHTYKRITNPRDLEATDGFEEPAVTSDGDTVTIVTTEKRVLHREKETLVICPFDTPEHFGRKDLCWKECYNTQDNPPFTYDEVNFVLGYVVTKTVRINHGLLRDEKWQ